MRLRPQAATVVLLAAALAAVGHAQETAPLSPAGHSPRAIALLVSPHGHVPAAHAPLTPRALADLVGVGGQLLPLPPDWRGDAGYSRLPLAQVPASLTLRTLYASDALGLVLGAPWQPNADALPTATPRAETTQDPIEARPAFTGTAAPGARPGTQRWIVHFDQRGFDLAPLTAEYQGGRRPGRVAAIVAELEARMRADQAPFVAAVERLGARVLQQWWLVNACAIEIDPARLDAVAALPNVAFLQPDEIVAPVVGKSTDALNHDADALQAAGHTGAGAAAAVLDTGHDSDMNGSGQIHVVYSTTGNKAQSRLLFNKQIGAMPSDDIHGHGTGVGSIVAGWRWNTTEADEGHAYGANIAGYAIADFTSGSSYHSTMATAFQTVAADAAANDIVATNLSYGGSPNPLSVEQKAADSLTLTAGVLNCTSAGNSGTTLTSSQLNLNGLSVGAVYPAPWPSNPALEHTIASFSCRGLINGNMPFPDICANGVSVYMARRDNEAGNYVASGTSMSSPQVCGAVTQLRARFPALAANETKAILLAAAQPSPGTGATQSTTGPGCGYLHNPTAHDIAGASLRHGRASVSRSGTTWNRTMPVTQGMPYQVAIAWNRTNVNSSSWANLNLEVRRGNTVVVSSANSKSTLEFVRFTAPTTGNYTIRVTGVKNTLSLFSSQEFAWATSRDTAP